MPPGMVRMDQTAFPDARLEPYISVPFETIIFGHGQLYSGASDGKRVHSSYALSSPVQSSPSSYVGDLAPKRGCVQTGPNRKC